MRTKFLTGNAKREKNHLGELGTDGSIILKWITKKWDMNVWTGFMSPTWSHTDDD